MSSVPQLLNALTWLLRLGAIDMAWCTDVLANGEVDREWDCFWEILPERER